MCLKLLQSAFNSNSKFTCFPAIYLKNDLSKCPQSNSQFLELQQKKCHVSDTRPTLALKDSLKHLFYFDKKRKTKEPVYKEAAKMWNSMKKDKDGAAEELIRKHEEKVLNMESYSGNQSNSLKAKPVLASVQKLATATAAATQITTTQFTTTKTVATPELSTITETFVDKLKTRLSSFVQCIPQEKVVLAALHLLAKLYLPICQQIDYWKINKVLPKQYSLKKDVKDLEVKLSFLIVQIEECIKITIEPLLDLCLQQENVMKKAKLCNA